MGSLFSKPPRNFFLLTSNGFTLLEILIAITIFGVLVSTIYSSLNAVLSRNDAIKYGADVHEKARSCLNRIMMDLTSIYVELPPMYKQPETTSQQDIYRFVAEQTTVSTKYYPKVRFTSMAHLPMSGSAALGIAEIVYYVMESQDRGAEPLLKRSDKAYPFFQDDEFQERESDPTLCEDVDELVFTYYDEDGDAHEEWNSESDFYKYATPKRIAILLKIKKNSETFSFTTQVELPVYRKKPE